MDWIGELVMMWYSCFRASELCGYRLLEADGVVVEVKKECDELMVLMG